MKVTAEKDYYKILGVTQKASSKDIKKRYRELAKEHHPDTNQGSKKSEETFKIISEAYSTLINPKKKKQYDRMRANGFGSPRTRSRNHRPDWGDEYDFGQQYARKGPREEPRDPFGRAGYQEEPEIDPDFPTRGFDLQFLVDVPFVLAALGGPLPFHYQKQVTCPDCRGSGKNSEEDECLTCKGTQRIIRDDKLDVDIPSGIVDQYTLRIPDKGGAGRNGGPPGDLLLKICIQPHKRFKKIKSDIYAETPIPPELAETGGTLEVETLDSRQVIEVEEGTLTGEEHRIPGAGSTEPWGKKRGDFVIKFHIIEH
jgi:DnaJ-class molecular chaperone